MGWLDQEVVKTSVGVLILLLCLGGCGEEFESKSEIEKKALNPTFTFETNTADEAFLEMPYHLSTDSENRIYVTDLVSSKVFVFNLDGEFVKTFGRRGRGPGEFTQLRTLDIVESGGDQNTEPVLD